MILKDGQQVVIHFRFYKADCAIDPKFEVQQKGGITCVIERVGKTITYDYAFCSPDDNFSKKMGRKRAKKQVFTNSSLELPQSKPELFVNAKNYLLFHAKHTIWLEKSIRMIIHPYYRLCAEYPTKDTPHYKNISARLT